MTGGTRRFWSVFFMCAAAMMATYVNAEDTSYVTWPAAEAQQIVGAARVNGRVGSAGVIPLDWTATLQPQPSFDRSTATPGVIRSDLRSLRALSGGVRRDYNYELFWMEFPLETLDGKPLFPPGSRQAELVVRIYEKEGRVIWPISAASGLLDIVSKKAIPR